MTMTISCARVVSVSASCGRHCNLTQSSFSPSCILMYCASWTCHVALSQSYIQCRYIPVSLCFTNYIFPYPFSSLCLSCNLSSSLRSLHLLQQPLTGMALVVCLLQQSSQKAIQQWGLQENSTRSPHCIAPLFI